jgi:hypothetical protein
MQRTYILYNLDYVWASCNDKWNYRRIKLVPFKEWNMFVLILKLLPNVPVQSVHATFNGRNKLFLVPFLCIWLTDIGKLSGSTSESADAAEHTAKGTWYVQNGFIKKASRMKKWTITCAPDGQPLLVKDRLQTGETCSSFVCSPDCLFLFRMCKGA